MLKKNLTQFASVRLSLEDLLGSDYVEAVVESRGFLSGEDPRLLRQEASRKVEFYPEAFQERLRSLLPKVGTRVSRPLDRTLRGATSAQFAKNSSPERSPLSALGYYRIGEDGRLYLLSKSEHYHAPLGHGFPGYGLIDTAKRLGIPNATHNNTRGTITRLLEEELVRTAAGIALGDSENLGKVLESEEPNMLNRVLNLETGSLVVEGALKMILSRFYPVQPGIPGPKYPDRIPVFLVIGDDAGALQANYHGTTVLTQTFRGMWMELLAKMERANILRVRAIRPNDLEDLENAFWECETEPYRAAGLFHEIVMMNYGGRLLKPEFLERAYTLCGRHEAATVVDEIQSCVWSPELYMFREYGLHPTFVAVGKGFPGGEFAASRLLFSSEMDTLPQFGALVTNGQEELASLAYLVTIRWAEANREITRKIGDYYEERLRDFAEKQGEIAGVEGKRHLAALTFHELPKATHFAKNLCARGFDISVQTYKTSVPPSALTKPPLIMDQAMVDFILQAMEEALREETR